MNLKSIKQLKERGIKMNYLESKKAEELLDKFLEGQQEVEEDVLSQDIDTTIHFLWRTKGPFLPEEKQYKKRNNHIHLLLENRIISKVAEMELYQLQRFFRHSTNKENRTIILTEVNKREITVNNFTEFSHCLTSCKELNDILFQKCESFIYQNIFETEIDWGLLASGSNDRVKKNIYNTLKMKDSAFNNSSHQPSLFDCPNQNYSSEELLTLYKKAIIVGNSTDITCLEFMILKKMS